MTDKYDRAIEYLTKHPEEIQQAWMDTSTHQAGCLFSFLGDTRTAGKCGCPTMVRKGYRASDCPEITDAIRQDDSVPFADTLITVSHLPRFAYYQRMYDATGLPR